MAVSASALRSASLLLVLHVLLEKFEADPLSAIFRHTRHLPAGVLDRLRSWLIRALDCVMDMVAARVLPRLQPRLLSSIAAREVWYGPGASQAMDVYRPAAGRGSAPVLLFVHGGIWALGNKGHYAALGQRWASEGFVAAVVGYSTWPEGSALEQAAEVRRAIGHARAHAPEWGGDPSRVFVSGQSSGANVSALAALGDAHFAGLIGMSGCYDVVEHFQFEAQRGVEQLSALRLACGSMERSSPTYRVERGERLACGRTLLLHGARDCTIPYSNSATFALALARSGQPAEFVVLPRADHVNFLAFMMLGFHTDALEHIKRFCGLQHARL